jgi:hypothetical protein
VDTQERAEHLQHDIDVIEHSAEEAARRLAIRAMPVVIVVAILVFLAWRVGRASRRD